MSEYQYYEFLAIDRPLSKSQIDAVREFSTRADISSTRFVNEYHWGRFRGDPHQFLKNYYDAMMYYANWGTRRFAFNLPRHAIDPSVPHAYCPGGGAEIGLAGDTYIVDLQAEVESGYEYEGGDMASLVATRAEVLAGDLRPLYLGWLVAVQSGEVEDEDVEPPVPDGMRNLSSAQVALADFLAIDDDLIDAAAVVSGPIKQDNSESELAAWVVALPQQEKDELLLACLSGEDPQALAKLRSRFRAMKPRAAEDPRPRRTVGELRAAAERATADRKRAADEQAAQDRARRDAEAARAQTAYLTQLAGRQNSAWADVERLVSTKQPKNYDEAVGLLKDLRVVAARAGELPAFAGRLATLLERHAKKGTFQDKIARARITPDPTRAC